MVSVVLVDVCDVFATIHRGCFIEEYDYPRALKIMGDNILHTYTYVTYVHILYCMLISGSKSIYRYILRGKIYCSSTLPRMTKAPFSSSSIALFNIGSTIIESLCHTTCAFGPLMTSHGIRTIVCDITVWGTGPNLMIGGRRGAEVWSLCADWR